MTDLKPCPFCGGEAEHYQYRASEYSIRCKRCKSDCGCWKEPYRAEYVWNRRPAEDALKAEVERLKAELDAQKSVSKIAYNDIKWLCEEVEKWKKMFYDLDDKLANTPEKGGEDD